MEPVTERAAPKNESLILSPLDPIMCQ